MTERARAVSQRESEPTRRRRRAFGAARRAELPTSGRLTGVITIVQEDRIRVQDALGHGFLLTVGNRCGVSMTQLDDWRRGRTEVVIEYRGAPDMGAVAERIRPA